MEPWASAAAARSTGPDGVDRSTATNSTGVVSTRASRSAELNAPGHHPGAFGRQRPCRRQPDAPTGAGHHRYLALEFELHAFSSRVGGVSRES